MPRSQKQRRHKPLPLRKARQANPVIIAAVTATIQAAGQVLKVLIERGGHL
jgi:hypothetical protein